MSSPPTTISKRVPRFVEEYAKDRNGTQAAIRAGFSAASAHVTAYDLLRNPEVKEMIAAQIEKVSKEACIAAADILREWFDIATADPSKITYLRRVGCRYCWGEGHQYQWNAREYAEACDREAIHAQKEKRAQNAIACAGGFGYRPNAEPHPECPECGGEGVEEVFFRDTESLTGPERKLIAGVKRTRDGVEVKMRDQDAALENLAKHLGMFDEKRKGAGEDVPEPKQIVFTVADAST